MACFVPENWESINSEGLNALEIDSALLISHLLGESNVEDCDNERLTSVIRSLEAEIIEPAMMIEDVDLFMELEWDNDLVEFCNYAEGVQDVMNDQYCSTSSDEDLDDYNWMDMEENMIEFEGAREYYCYSQYSNIVNDNTYATNALEEQSYGSLWQDTNALISN